MAPPPLMCEVICECTHFFFFTRISKSRRFRKIWCLQSSLFVSFLISLSLTSIMNAQKCFFFQNGGGLMGGPLRYSDVAVLWVQCDLVRYFNVLCKTWTILFLLFISLFYIELSDFLVTTLLKARCEEIIVCRMKLSGLTSYMLSCSDHSKTGPSCIQIVIFQTQIVSGF
jgi:hypothetical protein